MIEWVCICLHEASLPLALWCEITAAIMYLTNFIPTARNPNATPFELWHDKKPDVSHLQPLGCTAYARIPVEAGSGLSKLDPQSIEGILIGYSRWDAYRIYDPMSHQIYHTCDIIFEEGTGNKTILMPGLPSEGESTTDTNDHTVFDNPVTEECNGHSRGLAGQALTV